MMTAEMTPSPTKISFVVMPGGGGVGIGKALAAGSDGAGLGMGRGDLRGRGVTGPAPVTVFVGETVEEEAGRTSVTGDCSCAGLT